MSIEKTERTSWASDSFLKSIPKTDLHVHLDGSLRLSTLIELAQQEGVVLPAYTEAELRQTVFRDTYKDLPEYLQGFQYTVAVMRTAANLERIAFEFAEDNYLEGVRYFEVRFAPQLVAALRADGDKHLNITQVIAAVNDGLLRAKNMYNALAAVPGEEETSPEDMASPADWRKFAETKPPPFDYGIIVCAMRSFPPCEYYDAFLELHESMGYERICALASETLINTAIKCRDQLGIPIVALDVAGAEDGFQNKVHTTAFDIAHENFFNKTVHAGEGFGPESIFQAIRDLHAERIGHGYHLFSTEKVTSQADPADYVRRLVKHVSDRRINLEVCLTSNLGTMPGLRLEDHAMVHMLSHGVSVTLNTDNRLVSFTTVCDELAKAVDTFNLTPKQLRELVITGFKRSFFSGSYNAKRKYIRAAMDAYDRAAEAHEVEKHYAVHKKTSTKARAVSMVDASEMDGNRK